MNFDWQIFKDYARIVYAKAAQHVVFLSVCFYLFACVVAGKPVGPRAYVSFAYHCFQWQAGRAPVTQVVISKR
jgi:hypothetical protein